MSSRDAGPRAGGGRRGALRAFAGWWVMCAALWLTLVDRMPLDELLAGVAAATLGATAAVLVRRQRETLVRPRARWLFSVWRPLLAVAGDLRPLASALLTRGILRRREAGVVHELPFDAVGDAPEEAAFRVVTAALGSLGPNTIVLDVDTERRVLYAHQLVATPDPARAATPIARP